MTAEIAIMNLGAVALAADSAVTTNPGGGGSRKIFSSQNKLFALSDVAPVAILTFGNADFMSIPWETLIKEYRRRLGNNTFAELQCYADDFCRFLEQDALTFVSSKHQIEYAINLVRLIFSEIQDAISREASNSIIGDVFQEGSVSDREISDYLVEFTEKTVDRYYRLARDAQLTEDVPNGFVKQVEQLLRPRLREIRDSIFGRKLERNLVSKLNYIARKAVGTFFDDVSMRPGGVSAGIVVAGFGEEEVFPALSEIRVEGLVLNVLKKQRVNSFVLGPSEPAYIRPFAQDEMVYQFMQGIAPEYDEYLEASVASHLDEYTKFILESLDRYSNEEKEAIQNRLARIHPDITESFVEWIREIGDREFAQPVVRVVATLPKDQLAEMAEALVSLTSLKRRVSQQEETVGGPTDVALITKGDGLVWVKRKHYFTADLNADYFARKYRKG